MNKREFLSALEKKLSGLPIGDAYERINFYTEIIDDKIEEGKSEEEAILEIGSIEDITAEVIAEIPLAKIAKEKIKPNRRLKGWEITLLALGSPIWLSLLISAVAVILSLYAVVWAVVVSLWAVFISLVACGFVGVVLGIVYIVIGNGLVGGLMIGAGLVCGGLSILSFFCTKLITKFVVYIIPQVNFSIKKVLLSKEGK